MIATCEVLSLAEVAATIGVSPDTVLRREAEGRIPKRLPLGNQVRRWSRRSIEQWLAGERPAAPAIR